MSLLSFHGISLQKLLKDPTKMRSMTQFMELLIEQFQVGQTDFTTDD